jgi:peroxiredoxin
MKKLIMCLVGSLVLVMLAAPAFAAAIPKGQALPPITIQDLDGKDFAVNSIFGTDEKPGDEILLVFFNTSCSQCQKELKDLSKLAGDSGPKVVTIGIDMMGAPALIRYKKISRLEFPMYSDPEFKLGSALGIGFTPASAHFDKSGKLVQKYPGYNDAIKKMIHDLF